MRILLAITLALTGCSSTSPAPKADVTIVFSPSIDTSHYRTWAFDEAKCVDFRDVRFDADLVRRTMLAAIDDELERHLLERSDPESADVLVHYRLGLLDGGGRDGVSERTLGQIIAVDAATRRLVWVGERKAPFLSVGTPEEFEAAIRRHVAELLSYTESYEDWGR
ncbi:MAG: DUF4136 domain-containing protein [Planctomycetota bacterium]